MKNLRAKTKVVFLIAKREYRKIEPLVIPFFSQKKPHKYELFLLLGRTYQKTREWNRAIETLRGKNEK